MSPTDVKPSNRLVRAAIAERDEIARQRHRLHERRKAVLAELASLDRAVAQLDEREQLLARLAAETDIATATRAPRLAAIDGDGGKTPASEKGWQGEPPARTSTDAQL